AADLDASGFVAWLATHLKRTVGTGVIVICGRDQRGEVLHPASQGVFDYWACPAQFGDRVMAEIASLRNPDRTGTRSEDNHSG
ncbi:MAG TPA: DUF6196 family protein, partial [bacterium]|nr:DUF6196 family protein [bacterium]